MSSLKDVDDVCVKYPVGRETVVVKRALNMHVIVDDSERQRENIFHIICHVHNKVYSLIIDSHNCTNLAST
jgi:hypothetical protein